MNKEWLVVSVHLVKILNSVSLFGINQFRYHMFRYSVSPRIPNKQKPNCFKLSRNHHRNYKTNNFLYKRGNHTGLKHFTWWRLPACRNVVNTIRWFSHFSLYRKWVTGHNTQYIEITGLVIPSSQVPLQGLTGPHGLRRATPNENPRRPRWILGTNLEPHLRSTAGNAEGGG